MKYVLSARKKQRITVNIVTDQYVIAALIWLHQAALLASTNQIFISARYKLLASAKWAGAKITLFHTFVFAGYCFSY